MLEHFAPYIESYFRKRIGDSDKIYRFLSGKLVKRYLDKYRLLKLRNSIKFCYDNSPFYHDAFKKSDIKPTDVKSFEDMAKVTFTSGKDLEKPERFFAVPESKFVKIFSSSGTTGKPKMIYFTKNDLDRQISGIADGMSLLYRINENDRVRITYDPGHGIGDWGVRYCLDNVFQKIGAMSVVTGYRLPTDQEFELLSSYKISAIMGTPSYLHSISCEMEKLFDLKSLKIKNILLGTEPLPHSIREKLEKIWNTNVFQGYGQTEMCTSVAGECREKDGMHVTESDFFVEVIDPKTGDKLENGEIGELVITTLSREGMPLIRYRTHDLGLIMPEKCPCGLPFKRIKIKGRTDKMVTIGAGDKLFPTAFDNVILNIPSVIDYQIILDRKQNKDYITVIVETKSKTDKLQQEIMATLLKIPEIHDGVYDSKTILKPEIKLVKPKTLDRSSQKAQRIKDNRNLYD